MRTKFLFLSYTALLSGLRYERIKLEDLDRGNFFFYGVKRDRVFGDEDRVYFALQNRHIAQEVHEVICEKIAAAEEDGAVEWHPPGAGINHHHLTSFLSRRGVISTPLPFVEPINIHAIHVAAVLEVLLQPMKIIH